MHLIISIIDFFLFILFTINIVYLLFFSLMSYKSCKQILLKDIKYKKIAILIPAYKEDRVIKECVESCLNQDYPKGNYDVIVISDRMTETTNSELSSMPVKLIKVYFENSTKAKALNYAIEQVGDYDIALILDADNTIGRDFLERINSFFSHSSVQIVQAHRMAKNTNTPMALLDALSEEINNSIFRKGHVNAGFSAALIGSGMAFDYSLFKSVMQSIDAVGGFDRALELTLLYEGEKIGYLADADVLDEKVQYHKAFSTQRRRWLSAQIHYLFRFLKYLPKGLIERKWDFCDKLFQQMGIPRLILLGITLILAVLISIYDWNMAIKWWIIYGVLALALAMAVPRRLYSWRLISALWGLPYSFCLMFANLFRLKGANKKFIHTPHGIEN